MKNMKKIIKKWDKFKSGSGCIEVNKPIKTNEENERFQTELKNENEW